VSERTGIGPSVAPGVAREAVVDGAPVHYVEHVPAGAGHEGTVVLVHGLGGSHLNWGGIGGRLAQRRRVLVVDLPGFGRTRLHGRRATMDANAAVLERFVIDVAREPVTLVGNSMGGLLSIMAAARKAASIESIVLVDAAFPRARGATVDPTVALLFGSYMVPWLGQRAFSSYVGRVAPSLFVARFLKLCTARHRDLDAAVVAAHVALHEERVRDAGWSSEGSGAFIEAARSLMRTLMSARATNAMDRVSVPTLIVHGEVDRLVNVHSARAVAARRGWELEVLPAIGHMPQLEAPERFVEIVEGWLDRKGLARAGAASVA